MSQYLILISLIIGILSFQALAVDGTCATNPLIEKIQSFITKQKDGFKQGDKFTELLEAVELYKAGNGDTVWTTALTVPQCSQFNGENSCCTDGLVEKLPLLFKSYMRRKEKSDKPRLRELFKQTAKGLGYCAGKELVKKFIGGDYIKDLQEKIQTCRKTQFHHSIRFLKNTACAICLSGDQIATHFQDSTTEQPKLKVAISDMEEYDTESKKQLTCLNDLSASYGDFVKKFLQDNKLPESQACTKFVTNITKILDDKKGEIVIPENCKSSATFFGEGCMSRNEAGEDFEVLKGKNGNKDGKKDGQKDGQKDDQKDGQKEGPKQKNLRLLAESSDFVETSSGYSIYKKDENQDDTDFSELQDEIKKEDGGDIVDLNDIPTEAQEDDEDDSSSLLRLSVAIILAVVAFIF